MGPVEVLVFTFARAGLVASVAPALGWLVSQGMIRVVDAILVTLPDLTDDSEAGDDGNTVRISDLDDTIIPEWSSISSHPHPMLSRADAELAAEGLDRSGAALLVAIEQAWPRELTSRIADSGGLLELHARIDPAAVEAAARVDA